MPAGNLMWAQDPCRAQQTEVDNLIEQGAAAGNQAATMQLGGAPAPILAQATDPVPNMDPAVPLNEFVTPEPGANNQWEPLLPDDILAMIVEEYEREHQEPPDVEMLDEILEGMKKYQLWCPWGEPGRKNAKWNFKYKPINSTWVGNWLPK
ncbi:nonstructural protein 2 [Chaphamaparvovirus galliform5]|nr:nonstructural protein 2 [Chaphamaparvovirus galliform5]